jgi:uncharacterized protein (DUF433 family)
MMTLLLEPQPLPLLTDEDGVIRVGGTRVRLDTVLFAFNQGYTAEEIKLQYPTLSLPDIYLAIAYYLNNRDEVDAYLHQREAAAQRTRQEIEAQPEYQQFRERVLASREKPDETSD